MAAGLQARVAGKAGTLVLAEYSLDRLGPKPVLRLPTAKRGSADHLANSNVPTDLQEKVASLLASESSRKVRTHRFSSYSCCLVICFTLQRQILHAFCHFGVLVAQR